MKNCVIQTKKGKNDHLIKFPLTEARFSDQIKSHLWTVLGSLFPSPRPDEQRAILVAHRSRLVAEERRLLAQLQVSPTGFSMGCGCFCWMGSCIPLYKCNTTTPSVWNLSNTCDLTLIFKIFFVQKATWILFLKSVFKFTCPGTCRKSPLQKNTSALL